LLGRQLLDVHGAVGPILCPAFVTPIITAFAVVFAGGSNVCLSCIVVVSRLFFAAAASSTATAAAAGAGS
jgi:hypothetical protein